MPGHPELSQLVHRISGRGQAQTHGGRAQGFNMPKVGSKLVDDTGVQAVINWIKSLPENPEQLDRIKSGTTARPDGADPHSVF